MDYELRTIGNLDESLVIIRAEIDWNAHLENLRRHWLTRLEI